jgi:hypothetical protein
MNGKEYIDKIAEDVFKHVSLVAATPKPQKKTSTEKKSKSSDKPTK